MENSKKQLPLAFNIAVFSFVSPLLHYIIACVLGFILSKALCLIGFLPSSAMCRLFVHIILFLTCSPARAPWISIYSMVPRDEPHELMPTEELIQLVVAFKRMLYYVAVSLCLHNMNHLKILLQQIWSHRTYSFVVMTFLPRLRSVHQMLEGLRGLCGLSLQDVIWKGYPLILPFEYFLLDEEDYFVLWSNAILTTLNYATWPLVKLSVIVDSQRTMLSRYTTDPSAARYRYKPLNDKAQEIRLLHIEKTRFGAIRCHLATVELRFAPAFEAISYTWDNQEPDNILVVDGQLLAVTKNAKRIVYDRATRLRSRWIWIDAICIKQDDIDEKNAQVAMMGEIYSSAVRVVVWLDNYGINRWQALLALFLLAAVGRTIIPASASERQKRKKIGTVNMWRALEPLLVHEYWWRVWIIQEIACAEVVHIRWGGYYLSWQQFNQHARAGIGFNAFKAVTTECLRSSNVNSKKVMEGVFQLERIRRYMASVAGQAPMHAADYLSATLHFHSKDPRDQIYALCGMVSMTQLNLDPTQDPPADDVMQNIVPDYRITAKVLYSQIAKLLLPECPDLVINRAGTGRGMRLSGLPSWVPDWRQEREEIGVYLINYESPELGDFRYCAGLPNPTAPRSLSFELDAASCLRIDAIPLGCISVLSTEPFPFSAYSQLSQNSKSSRKRNFYKLIMTQLHKFHDSAAALAYSSPGVYPPTRQSRTEALWRTLVGDRIIIHLHEQTSPGLLIPDGFPAPQEFHGIYEDWHQFMEEYMLAVRDRRPIIEYYSEAAEVFMIALDTARLEGHFAMTSNGLMCMIPTFAQPGDHICVVPGLSKPVVLRPNTQADIGLEQNRWQLVGECYVHGFMQGEAFTAQHELRAYIIE